MNQAIIVDIDGTITNIEHRLEHINRKPKDWVKFYAKMGFDSPKQNVVDIVKQLSKKYYVHFVTGRPIEFEETTLKWLRKNTVSEHQTFSLHMRPDKDYRPDDIVKKEIYKKYIEPNYNVVAVFEDRTRVVEMWRGLGLTCLQVEQWKEAKAVK